MKRRVEKGLEKRLINEPKQLWTVKVIVVESIFVFFPSENFDVVDQQPSIHRSIHLNSRVYSLIEPAADEMNRWQICTGLGGI